MDFTARVLTRDTWGRLADEIRSKSVQVTRGRLKARRKSWRDWMIPKRSTMNTSGASRITFSFT